MKLLSFAMSGVRYLPDLSIVFGEEGSVPPVHLITGPPVSGTSSVLEAIAAAVAQLNSGGTTPDAADVVGWGGGLARIRTKWLLDDEERLYAGLVEETSEAETYYRRGAPGTAEADPGLLGIMSRYSHDRSVGKVVLIPAARVPDSSFAKLSSFEAEMAMTYLSGDPSKFSCLARAVSRLAQPGGDRPTFDRIAELFSMMCDSAILFGVGNSGSPELSRIGAGLVPIHKAGFSERNAFVLAAATIAMGLDKSVVLLDTPEMGLPAGMARRWVSALSQATPNAQWIVATRDRDLLDHAAAGATTVLGEDVVRGVA